MDHLPIEAKIKDSNLNIEAKQKREDADKKWSEEGVNHYHNREGWHSQKEINELWKEIKEKVKNATFKKEIKMEVEQERVI